MPSPVLIKTTPMSYRFSVTEGGFLPGYPFSVNDYVSPFIEMTFDHTARRWVVDKKYRYYNMKTRELYLPIYDLPRFTNRLQVMEIPYHLKALPLTLGKAVDIPIRSGMAPRDEQQIKSVEYLTTDSSPVRGLALQTGKGKTGVLLFSLSKIGRRAIIVLPGFIDQWKRAIEQFTLLTDDDIYLIQGQQSLFKLMAGIDKKLFPKIIVCSVGTLRNYCLDKDGFVNCPSFDRLCEVWDVGVRVIDEAHLNFHANLLMDLRLTPAVSIYLTATFDNSKPTIKTIFDNHYPVKIRFGEDEYHRYVDVYAYGYRSGINDIPTAAYRSAKGYSQIKWESWLLTKGKHKLRQITEEVYLPLLRSHYTLIAQPGEKCLILCDTVDMCKFIQKEVSLTLQEFTSAIYVEGTPDSVLETTDIIVSTPRSAGTGRDIKNLLTVFVTTSVRSAPLNEQMLGRLRVLPGRVPQFIYCFNRSMSSHVSHALERAAIFRPLAKEFHSINLP